MVTRTPYEQTQLARHGIRNQQLLHDSDAPVEYITEKCEASGFLFTVTPDTLIPRIETEQLIELSLESLKGIIEQSNHLDHAPDSKQIRILDVGTGSGYVGITIAKKLSLEHPTLDIQLVLSDISAKALSIAHINAMALLHEPDSKAKIAKVHFKVVKSDLLQGIEQQPFHVITANLPYIPSARIEELDASVKNFEPRTALDGGPAGFDFILKLLAQIPGYLTKNGSAWLEVDHTHTAEVFETALKAHRLDSTKYSFTFFTDEFGKNRFVECRVVDLGS
jgi:release factor glutamine methyltransferase